MIEIRVVIICDDCPNEFIGHRTNKGTPHKVKAYEKAIEEGWRMRHPKNQLPNIVLCPECRAKDENSLEAA